MLKSINTPAYFIFAHIVSELGDQINWEIKTLNAGGLSHEPMLLLKAWGARCVNTTQLGALLSGRVEIQGRRARWGAGERDVEGGGLHLLGAAQGLYPLPFAA